MVLDCKATSSAALTMALVVFCTRETESLTRSATEKNFLIAWFMSFIIALKAVPRRPTSPAPVTAVRTDRSPAAAFSMALTISSRGLKVLLQTSHSITDDPTSKTSPSSDEVSRLPWELNKVSASTVTTTTTMLPDRIRLVNDILPPITTVKLLANQLVEICYLAKKMIDRCK